PPPKGRVADLAVRRRLANCQQRRCAALLPDRAQRYVIAVAQPITDLRVFDNDMVPLDGPCAEAGRAPAPLGLSWHADVILANVLGFAHVRQDQHAALVVGVARRSPAAGKLGWRSKRPCRAQQKQGSNEFRLHQLVSTPPTCAGGTADFLRDTEALHAVAHG